MKKDLIKGFTLIEILTVVSIIAIVSLIVVGFFVDYRNKNSMSNDVDLVTELLYKARSDSVSSNGGSEYGVFFSTNYIVTFKGSTYTPSDPLNTTFNFSKSNSISNISLSPSGTNVVFDKLSGEASRTGTITFTSSATGETRIITIHKTGLVQY